MATIQCKKKFVTIKESTIDKLNKKVNEYFKKHDSSDRFSGTSVEFHGVVISAQENGSPVFIQNLILWTPEL